MVLPRLKQFVLSLRTGHLKPLNLTQKIWSSWFLFSVMLIWLLLMLAPDPLLLSGVLLLLCVLALLLARILAAFHLELKAMYLYSGNLQEQAYQCSANKAVLSDLLPLATALDSMAAELRHQRAGLYQRELLLDTVLQSSPSAIILTDEQGRVLLSNPAARQLVSQGKRFEGLMLSQVLQHLPELAKALPQFLHSAEPGLLHLGEPAAIWHLSASQFLLNQRQHQLYLLKPMTQEIQREELSAWKKLLRVIGHELNNSLAPLSSLAYSAQQLAPSAELQQILQTISDRCSHLNQFLQAYIQFAKLPPPKFAPVNWPGLINQLHDHYEFELIGDLPSELWLLDQSQLMQLLLNLLKNAHEAGATAEGITLSFTRQPQYLVMLLQDNGGGIHPTLLEHALLPFFTTKSHGSGIGLTLCRDIVEAHGGRLVLTNKAPGLAVQIQLPVRLSQPSTEKHNTEF
jgi:nitrogen fixation/metabolism regulation signal transduction histidine kinase